MTAKNRILALRPCGEAREWLASKKDMRRAWRACPRADWLLWLAVRASVDRKIVVMTACAVARTALRFVPAGEDRPRLAIETTEAWCRGEATIGQVRAAALRIPASAAADASAASAAAAAAAYAAAAAADAARTQAQREHADIVRSMISWDAVEAALMGAPAPREG